MRMWSVVEKRPELILRGHAGCVKALNFSQHAKGLASGAGLKEALKASFSRLHCGRGDDLVTHGQAGALRALTFPIFVLYL